MADFLFSIANAAQRNDLYFRPFLLAVARGHATSMEYWVTKILAAVCTAAWFIAASSVLAEPLVRMHTSYYYVDGPSASILTAQINQNGPRGADGERYAGRTKWDVQWKFRHEQHGTTCSMKEVAVAIGIAQRAQPH
jgi:predicted secreted Zn-dependent protease